MHFPAWLESRSAERNVGALPTGYPCNLTMGNEDRDEPGETPETKGGAGSTVFRAYPKTFNGLSARQWASLSRNVIRGLSPPRDEFQREHGATFPVQLAERLVRLYSNEGDLVVDPFLGTGTTLLAARMWNRRGIGIELSDRFCKVAKRQLGQRTLFDDWGYPQSVINDDCRNLRKHVPEESTQLVLTSPPYANFIRRSVKDRELIHKQSVLVELNSSLVKPYSDSELDFGNLEYDSFLRELKHMFADLYAVTKPGGYNVWIVKDYRDTQAGRPYVELHSDIAHLGVGAGFRYHDLIVWDQNEDRSLVVLGFPSVFYTNQNCSFIVVLRRPDRPT